MQGDHQLGSKGTDNHIGTLTLCTLALVLAVYHHLLQSHSPNLRTPLPPSNGNWSAVKRSKPQLALPPDHPQARATSFGLHAAQQESLISRMQEFQNSETRYGKMVQGHQWKWKLIVYQQYWVFEQFMGFCWLLPLATMILLPIATKLLCAFSVDVSLGKDGLKNWRTTVANISLGDSKKAPRIAQALQSCTTD